MRTRLLALTWLLSAPIGAQWLNYKARGVPRLANGQTDLSAPAPRLSDGHPDLSGVWAAECAIYGGDACFTQSLFFDLAKDLKPEDVQMTPWAAAIAAQRESRNHVDDPYGYCLPPGVPRIDFGGGPFKVLQTPGETAFLYESLAGWIFRQVFTEILAAARSRCFKLRVRRRFSMNRWPAGSFGRCLRTAGRCRPPTSRRG